jgi:hypothetical protein
MSPLLRYQAAPSNLSIMTALRPARLDGQESGYGAKRTFIREQNI